MLMGLCKKHVIFGKRRKHINRIYYFSILTISLVASMFFLVRLKPAFINMFTPYAVNIGSDAINFTVANYFNTNRYEYSDLVTLSYNNNNEVASVQANSSLMNKIKSELSIYLQEEISKLKQSEFSMPLGSVFDNIVLHGLGPNIKIKIMATDITDLNFNDIFEAVGINQVRHKIFIDAYVTISVNCASMTKSEVIHDMIPVAETVIVGQVPQYYSGNSDLLFTPPETER